MSRCILVGRLSAEGTLRGRLTVPEVVEPDHYRGGYEVIPSRSQQVLQTEGLMMDADVVVQPIPSNYGLITWDGSTLMVS